MTEQSNLSNASGTSRTVVLLDYENLCLTARSAGTWFNVTGLLQQLRVEGRLLDVVAYGDFTGAWYEYHRKELVHAGVRQVQLARFNPRQQKNRADIRIVVDAMQTIHARPDIDTVVIGSGDSDMSELLLALRASGRRVVVAAYERSVSDWLPGLADRFIDLRVDESASSNTFQLDSVQDPSSALALAVQTLQASGRSEVPAATLKPLIREILPQFDESHLGYGNFKAFLESHPTIAPTFWKGEPPATPQLYVSLVKSFPQTTAA